MAKSKLQMYFTDRLGNALNEATVTIKIADTDTVASTWTDRAGTITGDNPILTDSDGEISVYVTPGRYDITATKNGATQTIDDYLVQDENTTFESIINVKAFGAVGDGSTNDSTAFTNAEAEDKLVFIPGTSSGYQLTSTVSTTTGAWLPDPTLTWAKATDSGQLDMTRGFWTTTSTNGANIWRFADRVFVGAAADQFAGDVLSGTDGGTSWISPSTGGPQYIPRDAQLNCISQNGLIAISGTSRSSDQNAAATECIGIASAVVNDKASGLAWGYIAEVQRESGAGFTAGMELDLKNKGSDLVNTPYTRNGGCFGIWLASGGDGSFGGSSANPSNSALVVLKHASSSHAWNKGLIFEATSITGTDGVTGTGCAIQMARGHFLQWLGPSDVAGATIRSDVDAASSNINQVFDDNVVFWTGTNSKRFFQARVASSGVNFIDVQGAAASSAPIISSLGDDTNIDIQFTPKGTGILKSAGALSILTGTAIPAGGAATAGFKFSSTANFGIYFCSGAPTFSAAKGSLCLRSDGSSTSTRAYINTDGSTTWTNLTTAA